MAAASEVKAYRGIAMEGFVATWYAKNTAHGGLNDFQSDARIVTDHMPADGRVLDLAPGPGYLAIEIAKRGDYRVTGLDISKTFVRIAVEKARQAGVKVDFRHGNAARMPFEPAMFDVVVCRAAFKNFTDPIGALKEIYRVLKPGGRALILDLSKHAPISAIDEGVGQMNLSPFNACMTRLALRYLRARHAYTKEEFERLIAATEFTNTQIGESGIGLQVWLTK